MNGDRKMVMARMVGRRNDDDEDGCILLLFRRLQEVECLISLVVESVIIDSDVGFVQVGCNSTW